MPMKTLLADFFIGQYVISDSKYEQLVLELFFSGVKIR